MLIDVKASNRHTRTDRFDKENTPSQTNSIKNNESINNKSPYDHSTTKQRKELRYDKLHRLELMK